MERRETPGANTAGYVVVLLGVAGWVVSCFLPIYRITGFQSVRITLYRQVTVGSVGTRFGGALYLFGGVAAIGVFSFVGWLGHRRSTGSVLAGAVVAWSLASIGVLISIGASASEFNPGSVLAVGYWCLWASIVCVVAGTAMVVVSARQVSAAAGGDDLTSDPP